MLNGYLEQLHIKLRAALSGQQERIRRCAQHIAGAVRQGGIVHVFGTGHSHMLAEEMFYRAGGLVPVNAMLEPSLMLHESAEMSTVLERKEGLADIVFRRHGVRTEDVLIVAANSGRNPVPLEMALLAKERGVFTVGIGSAMYASVASRHSSGKRLSEIVAVFLNNHAELGDACMDIPGTDVKSGATSTIVGAALVNGLVLEAAAMLAGDGGEFPFFISANGLQDADAHNRSWMERYRDRIRSF